MIHQLTLQYQNNIYLCIPSINIRKNLIINLYKIDIVLREKKKKKNEVVFRQVNGKNMMSHNKRRTLTSL